MRPERANTLTASLASRIQRYFRRLDEGAVTTFFLLHGCQSGEQRHKLVTDELDQLFCTGADLRSLSAAWTAGERNTVHSYYAAEAALMSQAVSVTKPWAAGLDGTVTSSGASLAMHALFRFASPASVWCLPETAYGAVPTGGASFHLPWLEGQLGTYLALTGRRVIGHDLIHARLATHMIDPSSYADVCKFVSRQLSTELSFILPVLALFDQQGDLKTEPYSLAPHLETIASAFKEDSIERIKERLQEIGTPFARATLAKLEKRSLASLKLTLRLLREGYRSNDFNTSLRAEHAIMIRLWEDAGSDLHVGLRDVVFGSGQAPTSWPGDASERYVERMFAPATAKAETLDLQDIRPRPAHEAPNLFQYYEDRDALDNAAPLAEDEYVVSRQPLPSGERTEESQNELMATLKQGIKKLVVEKYQWRAEEVDENYTGGLALQVTSTGKTMFARVSGSNEMVEVPENIRNQILEDFGEKTSRVIVTRVVDHNVHPDFEFSDPAEVRELRESSREFFELGEVPPSRSIVSSESLEEMYARNFFDVDEELQHMLGLVGHVEQTQVEADAEQVIGFDEELPNLNKDPLTKREQLL